MHFSPIHATLPSRPGQLVNNVLKAPYGLTSIGERMTLERIEITPFAVIAGDILQHRRSGHLTILRAPLRKVLYWSQGELVLIVSSSPEDSLGDFLVRRHVINAERAVQLMSDDPSECVARFHESGLLDLSTRQTLLREWTAALF